MSDEHAQDDEVLDLEENQIILDDNDDDTPPADEGDDDGEVGFADEEVAAPAVEPELVKHLRTELRKRDKELALLAKAAPTEPEIVVGEKPTMEDCDWDTERYEKERDAWDDRREAAAKQQSKRQQAEQAQAEQWNKVTADYQSKKAALRYPDKDVAEQKALDTLSPTAQALIARHADNSALFMYAVGKSDTKLAELARIDAEGDPFAVVKAVTKMEASLVSRKPTTRPPNPDTPVRGKVIAAGASDKELAKLQAAADKSGDRSEVARYLRERKGR